MSVLLIFGKVVYFMFYKLDEIDVCEGGEGWIWGLDFIKV